MKIRVFKFGGASIKDANAIQNVAEIIKQHGDNPLVVVISALGKTTNAIEEVVHAFMNGKPTTELLKVIKDKHYAIIDELFGVSALSTSTKEKIHNHFVEVVWLIEDEVKDTFEYVYDQIVSVGELASTEIVAAYLNSIHLNTTWLDARDIIKTDRTFKEGKVNLDATCKSVEAVVKPKLKDSIVLTQGFIGGTSDNETTTLGREGSDYTGAILGYCLDAEEVTIWKDVEGVLNADPSQFPNATLLKELSYREAIEQTYYGARVIHPKTIKPLQNKGIPLHVRSFIYKEKEGSIIHKHGSDEFHSPVIIKKENQVLIVCSTLDFSFMGEEHVGEIMHAFAKHGIKINLIQRGAIKFFAIVDNKDEQIIQVQDELKAHFVIQHEKGLFLVTIRHYDNETIEKLTKGKEILVVQKSKKNYQAVLK